MIDVRQFTREVTEAFVARYPERFNGSEDSTRSTRAATLTGLFSASVFALPFSTLASTLTLGSPRPRRRRLLPSAGKLIMRRQ